ncbi:hypothetical protein FNU76_12355 [Chitinimonas arctica]|uniref:Uncharacterized protein n=1 Tax=Chitinimonas arctica TaxID=2594795 RepID=A0A516SFZ7_9NEIS|nr:hypothetical protein [Chitinimonas arctica]QDQ27089.1 hypothetical protein FNU76_12355 [Chitinimonas arctica]
MRFLLPAILIVLMAGCATTPQDQEWVVDSQYVAKVNQGAKMGGGQVIWLQYPTKLVPVERASGS